MKRKIIILTTLILFNLCLSTAAFQIEIAPKIEVNSPQITLGEIAAVKAPELSAAAVAELNNLSFKKSPNPGYNKRLTRVLVDLTIKNIGYSSADFKLKMPRTVLVSRASEIITETKIYSLVESYLKNNLDFKEAKIMIKSRSSVEDIKIAAGDYELQIAAQQNLSLPNTSLKLEIWQDGLKVRTFFYPVEINLKLPVLIANKNLNSNSKIEKSDFAVKEIIVAGDPEELVKNYSEIDFKKIKLVHSLKKGEALKFKNLKIPYVVKWGQKLRLRVNLNNIKISTFVKAKARGKIGDIIKVENLNSGYEFQAVVVSPTEVKMISD